MIQTVSSGVTGLDIQDCYVSSQLSLYPSLYVYEIVCFSFRLSDSHISDDGYVCLALTLMANPSCLKKLDVSDNNPGESAKNLLLATLKDPHFKIEELRYVL